MLDAAGSNKAANRIEEAFAFGRGFIDMNTTSAVQHMLIIVQYYPWMQLTVITYDIKTRFSCGPTYYLVHYCSNSLRCLQSILSS